MAATKKSKKTNKNTLVMMVVVGVLIGWIVGFAIGNSIKDEDETADLQEAAVVDVPEPHSHGAYESTADNPPSVSVMAMKDPKSGYNVRINTTNFTFSPENASGENIDGEGHAHLYVNGEKIGRVYGEWVHIDDLEMGENEIKVTLNTNDHKDYAVNGEVVSDMVVITVDGHNDHSHIDKESSHSEDSHSHSHN